jgi:GR25 family glycosyltransferase involved in LPS biosynthesis
VCCPFQKKLFVADLEMMIWVCLIILLICLIPCEPKSPSRGLDGGNSNRRHDATNLTFFWVNLERNKDRSHYMKNFFAKMNIASHIRIPAIEPSIPEYNQLKTLEMPCKRNTPKDVSCTLSHLKAMYTSIYFDSFNPNSNYAVIIEDDIKFLFSINFTELIRTAPSDFTILQISTSNPEAILQLYSIYVSNTTTTTTASTSPKTDRFWYRTDWTNKSKDGKTYPYWSTQGYIINKKRIFDLFLSYVLRTKGNSTLIPYTPLTEIEYYLINSFFPNRCPFTKERPCVLSNCLFADSYLYAGGKPTYVSTIPLITGSKVGLNSTIHEGQVSSHQEGFAKHKQVSQAVKQQGSLLPSFILG